MSNATRSPALGLNGTTDLYRFFDAAGRLLYVGISLSALQRAIQHRGEKDWWGDVARMEVTHLPTRSAAVEAERQAIISERPIHNVVYNNSTARPPALQLWVCGGECGRRIPVGQERGYIQLDGWGIWQCICRDCDETHHSRYWIDSGRIKSAKQVENWTRHLIEKRWFCGGDWLDVITFRCLIPGAHEAARRVLNARWPETLSFRYPLDGAAS